MRIRSKTALAVAVASALLFAACGGDDSEGDSTTAAPAETTAAATATTAAADDTAAPADASTVPAGSQAATTTAAPADGTPVELSLVGFAVPQEANNAVQAKYAETPQGEGVSWEESYGASGE